MNKLMAILPMFFIFIASISFILIVGCWAANYVPEAFFYKTIPFAIICAGALIALAILGRQTADKFRNKQTKAILNGTYVDRCYTADILCFPKLDWNSTGKVIEKKWKLYEAH